MGIRIDNDLSLEFEDGLQVRAAKKMNEMDRFIPNVGPHKWKGRDVFAHMVVEEAV